MFPFEYFLSFKGRFYGYDLGIRLLSKFGSKNFISHPQCTNIAKHKIEFIACTMYFNRAFS